MQNVHYSISKLDSTFSSNISLLRMLKSLYTNDLSEPLPRNWKTVLIKFTHSLEQQRGFVALAEEDVPIGYITWKPTLNNKWIPESVFILELYVCSESRKMGIGTALIYQFLNVQFSKEYKSYWVTYDPTEESLGRFYRKFGFKHHGKTDVGNIIMTRNIQPAWNGLQTISSSG